MPRFTTARVTAVVSERRGLQRVEVDGQAAYVLTELIGPVTVGDEVVVNITAVDLGLGSGGSHVVHWNLSRRSWDGPSGGHILKLRYTSLQTATGVAEEAGDSATGRLKGQPVVVCDLHSQAAVVARAFSCLAPDRRLVYVMTDSAALPLALSDAVVDLRARGVISATVTCGQAFGGDLEAVNIHSALQVAGTVAGADAVVVGPGPGVVGTRTAHGFSGLEVVSVVDAAARQGGRAIVAVRYSDADPRPSHRGVSHHTLTCLGLISQPALVAVPSGEAFDLPDGAPVEVRPVDPPDIADGLVTTMGRDATADPGFFRWALAAGALAAQLVADGPSSRRRMQ